MFGKGKLGDSNTKTLGSVLGKKVKIGDNVIIPPGQKIESGKIISKN